MPDSFDVSAYAKSLAAIADAARLTILFELLKGPTHAKRLGLIAEKNKTGIFYHLKVLERAGVVGKRQEDNQTEYFIRGTWIELGIVKRRGFQMQLDQLRVVLWPDCLD